jgi:conjugal transfer pilus assembly protein TraF
MFFIISDLSAEGFFTQRYKGWHWYEEIQKKKESTRKQVQNDKPDIKSPTKIIEDQQKKLKQSLHQAVVNPTEQNLKNYMQLQQKLMNQSQKFSENWQKVLYKYPNLDETVKFPVNQQARHIFLDKEQKNREIAIKKLSSEYGLFYFFRLNCVYCHKFAPTVKRFAQKYNWTILGISLDGGRLAEFPKAMRDNGIAAKFGIQHSPALIAVHPKTKQVIPLAYGMIAESEIERRAYFLSQQGVKND